MATDAAHLGPVFTSPTMRARAALVRALALTDELERAQAREDWLAVRRLARDASEQLRYADRALNESWALADHAHPADPAAEGMAQYQADGR